MSARETARIRAVAFDLDGTLIDTAPDLAGAAVATLEQLDLPAVEPSFIVSFIGNGIDALVERTLVASTGKPVSPPTLRAAGNLFREHYSWRLFDRSQVYGGVREGLDNLRAAGVPMCCVTNKVSAFTTPLLVAARLEAYFEQVLCAERAEQRKPRPDLLRDACARLSVDAEQLLMVGDAATDVGAARAAGCPVAAVDYGYGSAELSTAVHRPDWTLRSLAEIVSLPALRPSFDRYRAGTGY